MRRTGARLTLSGVMTRQSQLEPLEPADTKSSSLTKAEREIKQLKQENQKLRLDLTDTRSLYNQLIRENSHEKFDERRLTVLKSQIIQLERQVLLFSEALSSRSETLYEVENNLQWLADKCRSFITKDVGGPRVPIERSELTLMVETAESARIKLYKQIESKTTESLSRPLKFYSDFLQSREDKDVTLLEVALGQLDHLNLKHVTKLETKLSTLYKDLIQLHATMEAETSNDSAYLWTSCHVTTAVRERLVTQILKSCALLKDCSSDLLDLSLLFPSAPWPPLKTCALKEITAERVLGCIPSKVRSRSDDLNQLIQALVKAYNYKIYMMQNQNKCLREEVKYHQKVYNLQLKYTESLFQAIREAYTGFQVSSNELIVKPLNVVLEAYLELSASASEVSLKKFIQAFKDQVPHLRNIVETIEVKDPEESEGSKVLSQYGEEFFQSLEKLVRSEQSRRDMEAGKIDDIQAEQARLDNDLRDLLQEQEARIHQVSMMSEMTSPEQEITNQQVTVKATEKVNNDTPSVRSRTTRPDVISDITSDKKESSVLSAANENFKQTLRESKLSMKRKPLHTKDWVDIVDIKDVEKELTHLSLEPEEKNVEDMSNAELYHFHSKADSHHAVLEGNASAGDHDISRSNDSPSMILQTQKAKTKKKLNYVPNTFVPNRTLQLRRSGSLTRLAAKDEISHNHTSENQDEPVSNEESQHLGQKFEKSRNKNFAKGKPAFR